VDDAQYAANPLNYHAYGLAILVEMRRRENVEVNLDYHLIGPFGLSDLNCSLCIWNMTSSLSWLLLVQES